MRAIVTGSCGLVGYATCTRLLSEGYRVIGIDNDRRSFFFGPAGSTQPTLTELTKNLNYTHHNTDIRSPKAQQLVEEGADLIVHCAAQPSHDWAASNIAEDFGINAGGTLNILQGWYRYCKASSQGPIPFIHVSTSKVYGDNPNTLITYAELPTRYEPIGLQYQNGIPTDFPIDNCLHSFFGVSKLSGDLMAQEFGKYYGLPIGIFRPGCITGANHKGVELHGFLQYLAQCVATGKQYTIYGYKGKQVRCNIHAEDLVNAFMLYASRPTPGAVYNMGGRGLDCSLLEAVTTFERLFSRKAALCYTNTPRIGDHQWWISDATQAKLELGWSPKRTLASTYAELSDSLKQA